MLRTFALTLALSLPAAAHLEEAPEAPPPVSALLPLPSVTETAPTEALAIASRYPERLVFDVYRKGKKIGESVTSFTEDGDQLVVDTDLVLKVKVLFITAYKLEYHEREIWDAEGLISLTSDINDNGRDLDISGAREGDGFAWTCMDNDSHRVDSVSQLIPTNHWNPAVLSQTSLLNTLTGHQLDARAVSRGWELLETAGGAIQAERFEYEWELTKTESWYDRDGRWVGLRFKGKDGSDITYVCQTCGTRDT